MTTGRELAQKALREPMRSIGWQPRAAGWFTMRIADGFLGVIAVGTASKYCERGTALITLHVGIRDEASEEVVSRLCRDKDGGYYQRSVNTSIGYLMPECSWRQWLITPDNAAAVASELAGAAAEYAEPYLRRLASDRAELLDGVWHERNLGQPWGVCRVVVYRARYGSSEDALAYLDEAVAALGSSADLAANVVREMAPHARTWLASLDRANDPVGRDV
jgi:hypothetical protein